MFKDDICHLLPRAAALCGRLGGALDKGEEMRHKHERPIDPVAYAPAENEFQRNNALMATTAGTEIWPVRVP